MQCINFSEIIHVLKAVAIVASEYLNLSKIFCGQSIFYCYDGPGMGIKPRFETQKKCPFPLNIGVPSIQVTNTMIM